MKAAEECEEVWYPASTYVWCEGESKLLGRHAIFVSSPVRFRSLAASRLTLLSCPHTSCSLHGQTNSLLGRGNRLSRRVRTFHALLRI